MPELRPSSPERRGPSLLIRLIGVLGLVLLILIVLAIWDFELTLKLLSNPGLYFMVIAAGSVVALWGNGDFGGFGQ